jgi:rSAM/selenodomain-associated transferase 1
MTKSALLVFTRAPIAGQTKTRLIPLLGAQGAAEFHQTVLVETLVNARASDFETVEVWCDTELKHPFLQQCILNFSCTTQIQQGNDLGEKMNHAMHVALTTNSFVVLIGSDCPALTIDILNQSCQQLSNGKDAVLGPSRDGGYYLIGLKKPDPGIFQGINWGECDVADRTRQNFIRLGLDYIELEELSDIDTPDDYQKYIDYS